MTISVGFSNKETSVVFKENDVSSQIIFNENFFQTLNLIFLKRVSSTVKLFIIRIFFEKYGILIL